MGECVFLSDANRNLLMSSESRVWRQCLGQVGLAQYMTNYITQYINSEGKNKLQREDRGASGFGG
jgi:hypothetical protein